MIVSLVLMSSNFTPLNTYPGLIQEFFKCPANVPNCSEVTFFLSSHLEIQQLTQGLSLKWRFEWSLLAGLMVKPNGSYSFILIYCLL